MNASATKTNRYFFIRLFFPIAIVLFSGCASVPEKAAEIKPVAQNQSPVITYALSLQGVPYRFGKDTPEEGFDCSGFVKHVYQKQGISLPRTVKDMALSLPQISKNDVHSGDLVFFNTNGNSFSMSAFMSMMISLFMHLARELEGCWFPALKTTIGKNTIAACADPEGFDCCRVQSLYFKIIQLL